MAVKTNHSNMFSVSDDPFADAVDRQLEDFLQRLAVEGVLESLRNQGRQVALRRRESQDSLDQDGSTTGSLTETGTESDDFSESTDSEFSTDRDHEPTALVSRNWLTLRPNRQENSLQPASFTFPDRFSDSFGKEKEGPVVTDSDLDIFLEGLEGSEASWSKDGFKKIMDRTTESLSYTCWSRDSLSNPTEYRSRMILEDCDTQTSRDFFLDDAYRSEWDDARVSSTTLEDWNENGCQVAQWIRKFPLFLRDREYVVARKIWSLKERTFHCMSKLTTHPSAPKRASPWRVDSFLSGWRIAPIQRKGGKGGKGGNGVNGESTACEIINFHQEESGLSKNIAKVGISHGMWPYCKKIEVGIRKYHASGRNVKHLLPVFLIQADAKLQIKLKNSEKNEMEKSQDSVSSSQCSRENRESSTEDTFRMEGSSSSENLEHLENGEEFQECQSVEEFTERERESENEFEEEFEDCEIQTDEAGQTVDGNNCSSDHR